MTTGLMAAVLFAAFLHAAWNAVVKVGTSKIGAMLVVSIAEASESPDENGEEEYGAEMHHQAVRAHALVVATVPALAVMSGDVGRGVVTTRSDDQDRIV